MKKLSLRNRLLVSASLTLTAFLGLAGIALDRAFISSAKVSLQNELKAQVIALLTVIEVEPDGTLIIPAQLPESRLASLDSGLYALVLSAQGQPLWKSHSSMGVELPDLWTMQPGEERFDQLGPGLRSAFEYAFGVSWEIDEGIEFGFTLVFIEESDRFKAFIHSYRRDLVFWLGLAGIFLLIMQLVTLQWGLRPLTRVVRELDQIEHAEQEKILGNYPDEIAQLSERINLFIENERKNLTRYRNTLGDLAHSLKTPLAVIKGIFEQPGKDVDRNSVDEHVDRMSNIIDYQLKRAASSQFSVMHAAVDVNETLTKLDNSLQKVYADKKVQSLWDLTDKATFYGDESDLFELLGNVLDNAYKFTNTSVSYETKVIKVSGKIHPGVSIRITDDGPGLSGQQKNAVFQRGARVDQQVPGQGIGLAVAREVVDRYEGDFRFESATNGGASIVIEIPPS